MGWLPDTPDELFGAIVIIAVLGAVALVLLGRLALWVSGWAFWNRPSVNSSISTGHDYVAPSEIATPPSALFHQEREPEQEREQAERAEAQMSPPYQKLYTPEQIHTLREQAREAGAAEALGRLLGRQLVAAEDRTHAMELLFGPRGRRHQRVRSLSTKLQKGFAGDVPWAIIELPRVYPVLEIWRRQDPGEPLNEATTMGRGNEA